jgi:hypothetical protein
MALLKPATLACFGRIMVLDEMAETEDGEETEDSGLGVVPARGTPALLYVRGGAMIAANLARAADLLPARGAAQVADPGQR